MEKKKERLIIVIGIAFLIFLAIFLLIYFLVIRKPSTNNDTAAPKANDPAIESLVTIVQTNVYLFDFSTEEVHEVKDLVHLRVWPVVSFSTSKDIESFKIKNIYIETQNNYDVAVIYPGHVSNTLSQYDILWGTRDEVKASDIQDAGSELTFNVVDSAQYQDEIYTTGGLPQWGFVLKNLGEYNYTEIMNRDSMYDSGKILEYAGVSGDDLNMIFHFDIEIVFEDGERYIKRFSSIIEGEKYMEDQFYSPSLVY